jgi:hypothetical protein
LKTTSRSELPWALLHKFQVAVILQAVINHRAETIIVDELGGAGQCPLGEAVMWYRRF